jgi:hypothetical protein
VTGVQRTLAAVLGVAVLGALRAWPLLAAWAALTTAYWLWRLHRHPMGPCWACRGRAGRNPGSDRTQWGKCARCQKTPGGPGEEPRLGAVLLHRELRRK